MTNDLLTSARSQAEQSSSPVRAAARMRIARVESAVDPGQARVTFEIALDEIRNLSSRDRQVLFEQAQQVAAAFAPDLLEKIPPARHFPSDHQSERLLSIMLEHGHIDAAFDYVLDCDVPFGFPFGYAADLMHRLDDERRLTVLRCAMNAWRAPQDVELMRKHRIPHEDGHGSLIRLGHLQSHFIRLFQHQWKILSREEALAVVREIVQIALDRPDLGTSAGYPDGIHFTSSREHVLFEVLHILHHLDPPLAESLIASFAQLAAAAHRYPNGVETMHREVERQAEERRKQMAASGETCTGGFIMTGDPRDLSRQLALHRSSQAGDFGPSIDHALELYEEDTNPDSPNQALKAFWPSTTSLRNTLYNAGKNLGPNAATLLDRIPDLDLHLFAQIELAAALVGLPAFPETSMKQRRRPPMEGTPMRAPDGAIIRCPECRWVPIQEARWPCKCRHVWNTFDTRGLCPACKHQWEVTQCPSCGAVSAHAAWYPKE
jgi:hypothetical protein